MADGLKVKLGSFTISGLIDETQVVTGVGFQPKALIFFGNILSADGAGANAFQYFGFGTGASNQGVISAHGKDKVSTSREIRRKYNSQIITMDDAFFEYGPVSLQSLDSDGFTLFFANSLSNPKVNYLAIGGVDISAFMGKANVPTSLGLQSITGVGFPPDAVLFLCNGVAQAFSLGVDAEFGIGVMDGTYQAQYSFASKHNTIGYKVYSYSSNSKCLSRIDLSGTPPTTTLFEAARSSLDPDGYAVNWTDVDATATEYFFLALRGVSLQGASFLKRSGSGSQIITGVGFPPKATMFFTPATVGGVVNSLSTTIGAAVSPTSRATVWAGEQA